MAYIVKADMVPRRITSQEAIELTDDANTGTAVDTIITDVITEACGLIDSYCAVRYVTPLNASEQVKGLALDIAVFLLFSRRRRMPDTVQYNYEAAVQFLKDVAAEKASLDQPTSSQPQVINAKSVATTKEERFSDDNLSGYC